MNPPAERTSHIRIAMEQIALDSVGTLCAADASTWVREHLRDGCPLCRQAADRVAAVFDGLLLTALPVQPPAAVRARVLQAIADRTPDAAAPAGSADVQIWTRWTTSASKFYTLSPNETEWQQTSIAGIEARMLRVDEKRDEVTMLVRMAAGTEYPSHRHGGDEQCFVLEGDLEIEQRELRAGDYQFAPEGSIHGVQRTRGGCTLLLVSSRHDQILAGLTG